MAPQRGQASDGFAGPGTSFGGNSVNDPNPYDSPNCQSAYCTDEIQASRAQLAGACILLVAAVVAGTMVLKKSCSWLINPKGRDKSRQGIFWTCISLIIVSRSILVADAAVRLENFNPSDWSVSSNSITLTLLVMFFSWMPDLLIFLLVLFENVRTTEKYNRRISVFELANIAVVVILFILAMASWGLQAYWVSGYMWENYRVVLHWSARQGLSMTYAVVAFLYALQMLAISAMNYLKQGNIRPRPILLLVLSTLVWVNHAIQLAGIGNLYFGEKALGPHTTTAFAISATRDIITSAELIFIALVAKQSYEYFTTDNRGYGSADADAVTIVQPSQIDQNVSKKNGIPTC